MVVLVFKNCSIWVNGSEIFVIAVMGNQCFPQGGPRLWMKFYCCASDNHCGVPTRTIHEGTDPCNLLGILGDACCQEIRVYTVQPSANVTYRLEMKLSIGPQTTEWLDVSSDGDRLDVYWWSWLGHSEILWTGAAGCLFFKILVAAFNI